MSDYDLEPVVTYEVWSQERGKFGWKLPRRRRSEKDFRDPSGPTKLATGYTADEVDLARMEMREVKHRFFVVKATTTFEEMPDE